ncbi:lipocalin-like domain-containing protein [Colletotrichum plurivorum]|uniref:Lipocalin-like domain-containing protein n=1 Tax=Colletotrichum plurivorum TaxID=2175906 RepID=A0A8H6KE84_9PEZI|nr:lipocalin-like domain-containing protein [Colletotrichum plurivorum]
MRPTTALLSFAALAAAATNDTTAPEPAVPNVVPSVWDGKCFYPAPDSAFDLESYLGRWYQVAGTVAPFTAGCKCIYAQYSLNHDGTVLVNNTCQAQDRAVNIIGSAAPADPSYGAKGVLRVQFPGQPGPDCAGPNYIVQDYTPDFALVQSNNFTTLFVLSRQQNPAEEALDAWIARAGQIGSSLDDVIKIDQTGCLFT